MTAQMRRERGADLISTRVGRTGRRRRPHYWWLILGRADLLAALVGGVLMPIWVYVDVYPTMPEVARSIWILVVLLWIVMLLFWAATGRWRR